MHSSWKIFVTKDQNSIYSLKKFLLHLRSLVTMFVPVQLKLYKLLPGQQPD